MQSIFDAITEWLKGLLVEGIMGNLGGLFTGVNEQVGEIAAQIGMTPAAWNAGVFSMIRQLSETVILPIAGLVLTFVMTYELIQMLIDHNNLHNFDTWIFFKWIFKTFVAVLILSNTFNIVMAVFDVSQQVIQQSAGLIQGSTAVTPDVLNDMQTQLEAMELGPLLGIFLQSFFVQFTMTALNIVIFVIVYGRMIEIYLMTSLAPIPFATSANREAGHMGHNYFKSLFAIGFQGMLIMVCMAIYAVLVQSIATSGDMMAAIWECVGYTVLLPFLFLFEQKKVNRIVLRFCQFESLHYLKTSFSESRVATFGDVTIPALELSGLIWRSIIAGISIECFATVKTANVTDFSKNDRSQSVPHAGHRTKHFVLRHGLCYDPHLKIDLIGSFLRCGYEINTLILSHCG